MTADEIIEYKEKQIQALDSHVIDGKDLNGYQITEVFARTDDYVIYEIETNIVSQSLRVLVYSKEPDDAENHESNFELIKPRLNEVKAILHKTNRDNSFKQLIASAVATGIQGEERKASLMLKAIKNRINKEYSEQYANKICFTTSSLLIVFFLSLISFSIYYFNLFETKELIKLIFYVSTAGSMGGFISIILRLKKINIEYDLPKKSFYFYGIERIALSVISGIGALILVKAGLVFGFINEIDNFKWGYLSISLLAGFSEQFIPDVLNKIEKDNSENK